MLPVNCLRHRQDHKIEVDFVDSLVYISAEDLCPIISMWSGYPKRSILNGPFAPGEKRREQFPRELGSRLRIDRVHSDSLLRPDGDVGANICLLGLICSMQSLTIRVSQSTHELLRSLAKQFDTSITAVVDLAARDLQRKRFWEDFNASCRSFDGAALANLQQEDAAWEATLADGLEEPTLDQKQPEPDSR